MKKTATTLLIVLAAQLFLSFPASASSIDNVAARSALLIEKDSGIALFEQDIHRRLPADSLVKVMTLLLAANAVESGLISDNELVDMTESAWFDLDEDSPTQSISPGQFMTFIDLMYSAYVGNASEACNMLAIRVAGGVSAFVRLMNEKAAELGCNDTNFVNTHGRYHDGQYTTAYDMYLIYNEALKSGLFTEIAGTYRHVTERTEATDSRTLVSTNLVLNQSSIYHYSRCLTGITSNTFEGGLSMVASAEENGLSLISVVLGSSELIGEDESVTLQHFTETHRLFLWGFNNYGWVELLRTTDLLARVPVTFGSGADFVNVRPENGLTLLLETSSPLTFDAQITLFYDIGDMQGSRLDRDGNTLNITVSSTTDDPLEAPVETGDKLGEVVISKDGVVYGTIDLIANTEVPLSGMEYMRRNIVGIMRSTLARNIIIVLILIIVIYAALVIRYNIMRMKRLRRIKNAKNDLIRNRYDNFR